nr:sulfite exporter TauE/SafE family protein [Beijerinckia indica]
MLRDTLALLSGALSGFSLGVVGGGGSVLATPLLLYLVGLAPAHVAIGTGAVAVSVNAYVSFFSQIGSGRIRWRAAVLFALIGTIGAFIGSTLGKSLNGDKIIFLFGFAMVGIGLTMLRPIHAEKMDADADTRFSTIILAALAVGLAAGFFGIGGGVLVVPGLVLATGMPMINAVATSLLAVGTFGLTTAINYAVSGLIDWRIALEFILGGIMGGFLGVKAAYFLSRYKGALNKAFSLLIFSVAAYVLFRSGQSLVNVQ